MPLGGPRAECLGHSQAWQPCKHWGQRWARDQPQGGPRARLRPGWGGLCLPGSCLLLVTLTGPGAKLVRRKLNREPQIGGQEA